MRDAYAFGGSEKYWTGTGRACIPGRAFHYCLVTAPASGYGAGVIHTYSATLSWRGSTRGGYRAYSRTHTASASPAEATLSLTADPAFRGDASVLNPEQLLLMAASSCQLLSFLAEAALRKVDILAYDDSAEAFMEHSRGPMRIDRIVLRPVIRVAAGTDTDEVLRLVDRAHEACFIANSLNSTIEIEPRIELSAE